MAVFVLDKCKKTLMPASEKRARLLLQRGRAVVVKMYPFTIRLKDRIGGEVQPIRIKIDPGNRSTGIAVVKEKETGNTTTCQVTNFFQINAALTSRRAMPRRRRNNLRYRKPRFDNRTRPKGWLSPSLQHRVDTVMSLIIKLQKLIPITDISMELVRFDLQKMENPEISYLLEKWDRTCVYCNAQHLLSNLCLACHACNSKKGNESIEVFLDKKPTLLQKVTLNNSTRFALANRLHTSKLPVKLSSGGRTKFNRVRLSIPKTQALDALCVGKVDTVEGWNIPTLQITGTGRGSYQRTRLDQYGFPRGYLTHQKSIKGFQTGDPVKVVVTHRGRVAVRASGNFNITNIASLFLEAMAMGIQFKTSNSWNPQYI